MANFKKKPTIKELANVLIEVNSKVNETMNILRNLDSVFGLYVKMEGNLEKFKKFIEKEIKKKQEKENESKKNGNADKPNIQGDTDGESSGSKGVRKKKG